MTFRRARPSFAEWKSRWRTGLWYLINKPTPRRINERAGDIISDETKRSIHETPQNLVSIGSGTENYTNKISRSKEIRHRYLERNPQMKIDVAAGTSHPCTFEPIIY
ncbi:hypothetical protein PUN28_003011 [Cardiocondyla obscurior]|uniref:Uncharacterized protein n=1 Tax=Cardiocondyla obscurior TaxID=286306 RepID=A0AAW2GX28_9HYME